jgi:transposase
MISVCTGLFGWARYTRRKGAVKLHLVLDHDGYLPKFAVITDGKKSDISVALETAFEPGTIVVLDRGYYRFGWWLNLTRQQIFFVSPLKENAKFISLRQNPVPENTAIRKDEVIVAPGQKKSGEEAHFRRIELWDETKKETLVFVTNHHELDAVTVTEIYRDRWQIELFFKSLKQLLKIKTFVGTSANAVHIQIWTALISMLILRYLRLKATFGWSLSNLVALLRQQLFVHRPLWNWLNDPFQAPESPPLQMDLWGAVEIGQQTATRT